MKGVRDFALLALAYVVRGCLLLLASTLRDCADLLWGVAWPIGKAAAGFVWLAGWCERTALPAPAPTAPGSNEGGVTPC